MPSLIACSVLIATLLPAPAAGALYMGDYRDSRTDPDNPSGSWFRIDSTTRSVWTSENGRRWLMIIVDPFGWASYGQTATVRLDTDGDRLADYVMTIESWDMSGVHCRVRGDGREIERGVGLVDYSQDEYPVSCHVPLRFLKPTAEVAWRVIMTDESHGSDGSPPDRAPNVGWYV